MNRDDVIDALELIISKGHTKVHGTPTEEIRKLFTVDLIDREALRTSEGGWVIRSNRLTKYALEVLQESVLSHWRDWLCNTDRERAIEALKRLGLIEVRTRLAAGVRKTEVIYVDGEYLTQTRLTDPVPEHALRLIEGLGDDWVPVPDAVTLGDLYALTDAKRINFAAAHGTNRLQWRKRS